jgi:hypothetical protein
MIQERRFWVETRERLRRVLDELARIQPSPADVVEIIARSARREKTPEQRKLFHAICSDIGLEIGLTPGQVKAAIKEDFYGMDEFFVGNRRYRGVQSSEDSDRDEYSRLIDYAYQWAAEREVHIRDWRRGPTEGKEGGG